MKFNKILFISIVLLAILSLGAVSAQDDISDDVSSPAQDDSTELSLNDDSKLSDDASTTYNKEVYVNNATGSDTGAGSEASPYSTINKAISEVNASEDAVIYLGSGTYSGEGNTNLKVSLAHKNYGGSLTFMGASDGTTKIDGNGVSPIFASISADSIVTLKNIVFINGKNNLGSAVTSAGNLTVENCVFEDNYATTLGALYFNGGNQFAVINTTFKNNFGSNGYADMYYSYSGTYTAKVIDCKFIGSKAGNTNMPSFSIQNSETYIIGNTFENLTGGSTSGTFQVSYGSLPKYVINNTFINCNFTSTSAGGIFATQNSYLENNIFINCTTKSAEIYAQTEFNAKIKFLNATINGTTFKLYANVTDDVGNLITTGGNVYFFIDGAQVGTGTVTKGVASTSVSKLLENGNYTISGYYSYSNNPFECEVENATLTVDFNHNPLEIWVSPDGNDTNGTGSEDDPFLTLKHALDYGFKNTVDLTIHLKDGVYNGSENRGLSYSPVGKLTIIGESYGKAIIDAEKAAATIFTFGQNLEVKMANMTLLNATGRVMNVYNLELVDSIIKNVGSFYAQYNSAKIFFDNLTYENSGALQMYNSVIYNSIFINNDGKTSTGLIWAASYSDNIVDIQNTSFINNKIAGYSGGAALYVQSDALLVNNRYVNNTVSGNGKFIVYCSGNKIISINETFIENNATGFVGEYYSTGNNPELYIENIVFENNIASGDGAALALHGGLVNGAKFINNTAGGNGGAIYLLYHSSTTANVSNLVLKDVLFENNKAVRGSDIFIQEPTSNSYAAGVLENITITAQNKTTDLLADTLKVTLTHESGAIIGGGNINFYIDGNIIGTSPVDNSEATFEYLGFKNGTYKFGQKYSLNSENYENINGTITVALKPLLDNITLYVSDARGDDEKGNGSYDNPFKTIQTALSAGYSQSPVVVVNVLEGSYIGEKNVNLNVPTGVDITINGAGVDKTFINDTTADYFIKALAGDGSLTITNLTMNRTAKRLNQMINILEGATVTLDNVFVTRGIGNDGGAISSAGTLIVKNSYFYNNGLGEPSFSSRAGGAIYNTGVLLIYDTTFYANHASGAAGGLGGAVIYNTGDLEIYSSNFNDSICDYGMNMAYMAIQGTATSTIKMYDTVVSISGRTAAEILPTDLYNYNGRAVPTIGIGQAATGLFVNCTFDGANVLNHAGSIVFGNVNNWNPVYIRNITVVNSTFKNLKAPTVMFGQNAANMPESYRVFENCLFDNVQFLYANIMNSEKVHVTINNSVILPNGTQMIGGPALKNSDITGNWWGNNSGVYDLVTVTVTRGNANAFYNVSPSTTKTTTALENWIALTATKGESDIVLEFKVYDGETYSDYASKLSERIFTISAVNGTLGANNGTITKKVSIPFEANDLRYSIKVNVDNAEILMEFDERNATVLNVVGIDKDLGIITTLKDTNGNPIAGETIDYAIGNLTGNLTSDENGTVVIPCLANGELTINFAETNELLGSNTTFLIDGVVKAKVPLVITVPDEIEIGDDVPVIVSIENATGNVTLYVDGIKTELELEGGIANHIIKAISEGNHTIVAIYAGNDLIYATGSIGVISNITKKESSIDIAVPDEIKVGSDVNAIITIENATGKATIIFDGAKTIQDLVNGIINYTISAIAAGKHSLTVVYDGDEINAAAFNTKAFTAEKQATKTEIALPVGYKVNDKTNITITVSNGKGSVDVFIDGVKTTAPLDADGKAIVAIETTPGEHGIVAIYAGDDAHESSYNSTTMYVEILGSIFANTTITGDLKVSSILVNSLGDAIANTTVFYTIDGVKYNTTTDTTGKFTIQGVSDKLIVIEYEGTDYIVGTSTSVDLKDMSPAKTNVTMTLDSKSVTSYTIDTSAGEKGSKYFVLTLKDENGVMKNATVKFTFDGKEYTLTTDENGTAKFLISKQVAKTYTGTFVYLGDDTHNANYAMVTAKVYKKSIKITAKAKTFKTKTKTKKYVVTLKTIVGSSATKKAVMKSGKVVYLKVNGKTYKAKTNSKGKATIKITKLKKKGKYTAKITVKADSIYKGATKKVKITVK